jgi:hypothetical protein
MSKSKHTLGPWFIRERQNSSISPVIIAEVASGYTICWVNDDDSDGIQAGDAALIAAAPDLLKQLEQVLESIEREDWTLLGSSAATLAIRCAILKAKGEA